MDVLGGKLSLLRVVFWGMAGLAMLVAVPGRAADGRGEIPGGLRLLMIESASCGYCRRWHREVGPAYPMSSAGRQAPLVRRDITDPVVASFGKVIYTPTFILVRDGREVDRLVGYPGAEGFWEEIGVMLARIEPRPEHLERFTSSSGCVSTPRRSS
jgi:hypothetical protein